MPKRGRIGWAIATFALAVWAQPTLGQATGAAASTALRQYLDALPRGAMPADSALQAQLQKLYWEPMDGFAAQRDLPALSTVNATLTNWMRDTSRTPTGYRYVSKLMTQLEAECRARCAKGAAGDLAMLQAATLLRDLPTVPSRSTLLDLLKHRDAGVRYQGASAMLALVRTTKANLLSTDVQSLSAAAAAERSIPTLDVLTQVLLAGNSPEANAGVAGALAARVPAYAKADLSSADLDRRLIQSLASRFSTLPAPAQAQLRTTIGQLIQLVAVELFGNKSGKVVLTPAQNEAMFLLVRELESAVSVINGSVSKALTNAAEEEYLATERLRTQVEAIKYVGDTAPGALPGKLQDKPWSLPPGAGVQLTLGE